MTTFFQRKGNEFLVNSEKTDDQLSPSISALVGGGFVVTWTTRDSTQDGDGSAVKAQRFDAWGMPLGDEFLVNSEAVDNQFDPVLTGLTNGGFVIAWQTRDPIQDGSDSAIKAQLFDAFGAKIGGEFLVNTVVDFNQSRPAIAALADGGFVVAWDTAFVPEFDGDSAGASLQIFDASGAPRGGEFLVSDVIIEEQQNPLVAGLSNGDFVAIWGRGEFGIGPVLARIYDASGVPRLAEFQVASSLDFIVDPSVIALANGGFVVTWNNGDELEDGTGDLLKARLYDNSGAPIGSEFVVDEVGRFSQGPKAAALPDGGFVLTWLDTAAGGGVEVKARVFDAAGTPQGGEFPVGSQSEGDPEVTPLSSGGLAVTWSTSDTSQDGSGTAVKAVILEPATPPSIPITDGLVAAYEEETVTLGIGDHVTGWMDGSGQSNDLFAQGDPSFTGTTPTGRTAIVFDGTGDLLQRSDATDPLTGLPMGNGDRSMFFVVKYEDAEGVSSGLVYGNGAQNEAFGLTAKGRDDDLMLQGWGVANDFDSDIDGPVQGWIVQSVVLEDGMFRHYQDGELIDSGSQTYATELEKLIIGGEIADKGESKLEVGAALIYDDAVSDVDRLQIEDYLQTKYIEPEAQGIPVTAGLVAAYEEDTVTLGIGDHVTGWMDASGQSNDLFAQGDPSFTGTTPTGRSAVVFDGTGDLLQRTDATDPLSGLPSSNADRSMFFVVKYEDAEGVASGLVYGNGAQNEAFGLTAKGRDDDLMLQGWGVANDFDSDIDGPAQGWIVQSVVLEDGMFRHYQDGELIDSGRQTYATDVETLIIGGEIAGKGESKLEVGAALIYDDAVSDVDRLQIEDYLQTKYIDDAFIFV